MPERLPFVWTTGRSVIPRKASCWFPCDEGRLKLIRISVSSDESSELERHSGNHGNLRPRIWTRGRWALWKEIVEFSQAGGLPSIFVGLERS